MISASELYVDHSFSWEYGVEPDLSLSWREKMAQMSTRVISSVSSTYDKFEERAEPVAQVAEKIMKVSAAGAVLSAAFYVAVETLSHTNNTQEALLVLATAVSLGLAAREQAREPELTSLQTWRNRDRI